MKNLMRIKAGQDFKKRIKEGARVKKVKSIKSGQSLIFLDEQQKIAFEFQKEKEIEAFFEAQEIELQNKELEAQKEIEDQRKKKLEAQKGIEAKRAKETEAFFEAQEIELQKRLELEAQRAMEIELQKRKVFEAQRAMEIKCQRRKEFEAQGVRICELQKREEFEAFSVVVLELKKRKELEAQREQMIEAFNNDFYNDLKAFAFIFFDIFDFYYDFLMDVDCFDSRYSFESYVIPLKQFGAKLNSLINPMSYIQAMCCLRSHNILKYKDFNVKIEKDGYTYSVNLLDLVHINYEKQADIIARKFFIVRAAILCNDYVIKVESLLEKLVKIRFFSEALTFWHTEISPILNQGKDLILYIDGEDIALGIDYSDGVSETLVDSIASILGIANNIAKIKSIKDAKSILKSAAMVFSKAKDIMHDCYFKSSKFTMLQKRVEKSVKDANNLNSYIIGLSEGLRFVKNESLNKGIDRGVYSYDFYNNHGVSLFSKVENVYYCSRPVLQNAKLNPFKYVCKYFDIEISEETLNNCEQWVQAYESIINGKKNYETDLCNLQKSVVTQTPKGIGLTLDVVLKRLELREIEIKNITFPVCIFEYQSYRGNSEDTLSIKFDIDTMNDFISYIGDLLIRQKSIKYQRALMTSSLRKEILRRDNYTCKYCGNSTYNEPNLLLEVDHIKPVSKGGLTVRENLQTLCWRCNRSKSNKEES